MSIDGILQYGQFTGTSIPARQSPTTRKPGTAPYALRWVYHCLVEAWKINIARAAFALFHRGLARNVHRRETAR